MELTLTVAGTSYRVNTANAHDISIAVRFDGTALTAFGAGAPSKEPFKAGSFIGDVGCGGSCNCDMLHFAPHLHGTHTESLGHLTREKQSTLDTLSDSLIPATVISVTPEAGVITEASVKQSLTSANQNFLSALVVRTLPNPDSKRSAHYGHEPAPYFAPEAMAHIATLGVKHLLCDLPSVDKMDDGGALASHRIFWGVAAGVTTGSSNKTITELVYVNDNVADGIYLLNLQIAPLMVDATTSRPLLYGITAL